MWEINNAPARLTSIKAGDKVIFKQASLGLYFIRINGQMGIKGKRIQLLPEGPRKNGLKKGLVQLDEPLFL